MELGQSLTKPNWHPCINPHWLGCKKRKKNLAAAEAQKLNFSGISRVYFGSKHISKALNVLRKCPDKTKTGNILRCPHIWLFLHISAKAASHGLNPAQKITEISQCGPCSSWHCWCQSRQAKEGENLGKKNKKEEIKSAETTTKLSTVGWNKIFMTFF